MINRTAAAISAALTLLMFALATWAFFQVPDTARVPIHFGLSGAPDRWAGPLVGLFLMPVVAALTSCVMLILPFIDPRRENLRRSLKAFGVGWVAVVTLLALIHGLIIAVALGRDVDAARIVPALVGILFVVIGNVLGKVRPNFSMGIRTPWALSDDGNWDKTHRFGGWIFVIGGMVMVVAAVTVSEERVRAGMFVVVLIGIVLLPLVKSYLLWRRRAQG